MQCLWGLFCNVQGRPKMISSLHLLQQGKCSIRSFNFKMVVNNSYRLKHIQLTKHTENCIQNIYHMYYATVEFLHFKLNLLIKSHDCYDTKTKIKECC